MAEISFTIPGKPESKGRPKFVRATGKAYTPGKTAMYENWVKECWCAGNFPKLNGPVKAWIYAYFPIPQSASKKKRALMESGAIPYIGVKDLDNIAKCVLDSLNGLAYDDDRNVVDLLVIKRYSADPRCEVTLFGEEEQCTE